MKSTMLFFTSLVIIAACSKDSDNKQDACDEGNYGILTVNYGSSAVTHSILITPQSSTDAIEKITPKGLEKDTVHLAPGNYALVISSLTDDHLVIDDQYYSLTGFNKCDQKTYSVDF